MGIDLTSECIRKSRESLFVMSQEFHERDMNLAHNSSTLTVPAVFPTWLSVPRVRRTRD